MNFALQLVNSKAPGMTYDTNRILSLAMFRGALPQPAAKNKKKTQPSGTDFVLQTLENVLLAGDVSPKTDQAIRAQLADPKVTGDAQQDPTRMLNVMTALVLGSPEFQKR
jgi:signal recognition particle GTPase